MNNAIKKIKAALRKTPLFIPLKWFAALFGYGTYPLPFSTTALAEPFLERAITRIGHAPDPAHLQEQFYSYFSEMWAEGYESILNKQYESYLPFIKKIPDGIFLDIGCGAGEFVDYLVKNNINAHGLDTNGKEIERLTQRGLNGICVDAETHLETNNTVYSGISMLEVIEHIPKEKIDSLLSLIYQKLTPGGAVLVETINVKNSLAFHSFYTDPTHQRPIPIDLLTFMLQWHGFINAKIIYTTPIATNLSEKNEPSRSYFNYAIFAIKP